MGKPGAVSVTNPTESNAHLLRVQGAETKVTTILCSLVAWAQFLISLDPFPPLHIRTITISIQGCCRTKPACSKALGTSKAPVNAGNYSKTKPNSLTPWARGTSLKCSGSRHRERQLVGGEIPLETALCVSGGRGMACPLPALAARAPGLTDVYSPTPGAGTCLLQSEGI